MSPRGTARTYSLNQYAFDTSSFERDYWVGFIMADGNICGDKSVVVELHERDEDHLEKLRKFVGSSAPIATIPPKGWSKSPNKRLSIHSKYVVNALKAFGIVPNKSKTANPINYFDKNPDFWRGVMDGDGTVGIYHRRDNYDLLVAKLIGSFSMCQKFLQFSNSIRHCNTAVRPERSIFTTYISGRCAQELVRHIYPENCCSLERKRLIAQDMIGWSFRRNDKSRHD